MSSLRQIKHIIRKGGTVLLLLTLAGCGGVTNFVDTSASSVTESEASLYRVLIVLSALVFAVVVSVLTYDIIRFRVRPGAQPTPDQHYRHLLIEGIYTGIPLLIVIGIFILTLSVLRSVAEPADSPDDLAVQVVGHQWWWEFDYPNLGIITANELVVPVDTTIQIDLHSVDVIHSFYVPALSGKTDVIPGVNNSMWFRAEEVGDYPGQCAEFCGLNHANMRFVVRVVDQSTFDEWVANQQQPPTQPETDLEQRGHDIIVNGVCSSCHVLGDNGPQNPIGPNLTHLFSRSRFAGGTFELNVDNLRRWLQNTQAMKPGNDMQVNLSSDQIDALIAYLQTLE
ncbi:MAG: cytochrome c oxidase subunit II [Anaerolineae bacterium]|nr:cytochrome c oxidase subunit II [Anaerolineae bacterium]